MLLSDGEEEGGGGWGGGGLFQIRISFASASEPSVSMATRHGFGGIGKKTNSALVSKATFTLAQPPLTLSTPSLNDRPAFKPYAYGFKAQQSLRDTGRQTQAVLSCPDKDRNLAGLCESEMVKF